MSRRHIELPTDRSVGQPGELVLCDNRERRGPDACGSMLPLLLAEHLGQRPRPRRLAVPRLVRIKNVKRVGGGGISDPYAGRGGGRRDCGALVATRCKGMTVSMQGRDRRAEPGRNPAQRLVSGEGLLDLMASGVIGDGAWTSHGGSQCRRSVCCVCSETGRSVAPSRASCSAIQRMRR
jgi:hypothetical protein